MPARTSARCSPAAHPLRRRDHVLRAGVRAGADAPCGTKPTPSPTPGWARAPTSWWCAPPPRGSSPTTAPAAATTCSPPRSSPPGRPSCLPGDAHRDVGAPAVQDNLAVLAERGVHIVGPSRAASPAATSAPGAWPTPSHRGRGRAVLGPADLAGHEGRRHRRRHPRGHRPGALHRQPLVGQAGLRHRRRGRARGAEVTLVTTVDRRPRTGCRDRHGRVGRRDARRRDGPRRIGRRRRHGRRRGRLPPVDVAAQAQEGRRPAPDRARAHRRHPRRARPAQAAGQVLVGFAAETDDVPPTPRQALPQERRPHRGQRRVGPGVGFEHDTNAVVIYGSRAMEQTVP
jgi:phosphopantothenoylcysteine decarboxylase / phosphopantothenate---cysteine ligase